MNDLLVKIFEVCVALVAAVMGLAYPMFVEGINRIADKYRTPNILKKFKKETHYKSFKGLMIACIMGLFLVPFLIKAFNFRCCRLLLIIILGICVIILCLFTIRVFSLLMTYSDPHSLFDKIKTKDTNEEKLMSSLQILIEYSSRNDVYADIYREAMDILMGKIAEFQKERVKKSQTNKQTQDTKYFEYPPHIFDVIKGLRESSTKPGNATLNRNPEIVDYLYNLNDVFPLTIQMYDFMWVWIKRMVEARHDEWVRQYWLIANQTYYSKWGYYGDNEREGIDKFLEFHLMVGVLLFYQKRYDVLHYAFTFTNFSPPKYPLIPNTFRQIFEYCEKFPVDEEPFYLTNHYNMFKAFQGSNMENMIEGLILDYLALLMVRLFINNYNITYSNPMELPDFASTVEGYDYKIDKAEVLMKHLETIPNEAIEELDLKPEWKQDAKKLLEDFISKCKNGSVDPI